MNTILIIEWPSAIKKVVDSGKLLFCSYLSHFVKLQDIFVIWADKTSLLQLSSASIYIWSTIHLPAIPSAQSLLPTFLSQLSGFPAWWPCLLGVSSISTIIATSNASNAIILFISGRLSHFVSFYGRVYSLTPAGAGRPSICRYDPDGGGNRPYLNRI